MSWWVDAIHKPIDSFGYGQGTKGQHRHLGIVDHSAVGSATASYNHFRNPQNKVSAHFIVLKDGPVWQFVDTDDVAWHAGDSEANLSYWGIEHEGGPTGNESEPLTEAQYKKTLALHRWLWDTYVLDVSRRRVNLWEHNELKPTQCPSGRIPWDRLIADLKKEDEDMAYLIKGSGPKVYTTDGVFKRHVPNPSTRDALIKAGIVGDKVKTVPDKVINFLRDAPEQ